MYPLLGEVEGSRARALEPGMASTLRLSFEIIAGSANGLLRAFPGSRRRALAIRGVYTISTVSAIRAWSRRRTGSFREI